jgi:hypothetical protein
MEGRDCVHEVAHSPHDIMPTSKFRVRFTPAVQSDGSNVSAPSMHEFSLDLGLGSGSGGTAGESEARVMMLEERSHAKRPDNERSDTTGETLDPQAVAAEPVPGPDPATSTGRGSFNSDRNHGYPHEWLTMEAFQEWCRTEECAHTIELRVAKVEHGAATLSRSLWTTKFVYRCARQRIGQKADQKKFPDRQQKLPRKGTGCHCQIVIKSYPHTTVILGRYVMVC